MGVPQGSVLGPLLFTLYINNFSKNIPTGTPILYADDTAILFEARSINDLNKQIKEGMKAVTTWLKQNKLTINVSKSVFQTYGIPPRQKQHIKNQYRKGIIARTKRH